MTWEAELSTVRQLLRSNWSTTPIAWPGEHFIRPDQTGLQNAPGAYLRVGWNHDPAIQGGMTAQGVRVYPGLITIMIMIEPHVGTRLFREYADTISAIFRTEEPTADRIWFLEPWYRFHGQDGEWVRADLNIPFTRLESFGVTDSADLAGSVSDVVTITDVAHGRAVGEAITWDEAATPLVWALAIGDGVQKLHLTGLVTSVPDVDTFRVATGGSNVVTAHGETLGALWVDVTTAGALTSTEPTSTANPGKRRRLFGAATTANRITVVQKLYQDL